MRIFITFLIGVFSCSSCQENSEDLNGHWHIHKVGLEPSSFGAYSTIDIEEDSLAVFDKDVFTDYGFGGVVDPKKQLMLFGGECLVLNFRYKLLDDVLVLNQMEYDEKNDITFVGKRCDHNCCDLQEEFFKNTIMRIDLAYHQDIDNLVTYDSMPSYLRRGVYVGKVKKAYYPCYNNDYIVSLGGQTVGYEDLELWREKQLIKLPENKRSLIRVVIYADKNSPKDQLIDLINQLLGTNNEPIYLALQVEGEGFRLGYLSLPPVKDSIQRYIDLLY
ncbi:hypothetical protein [Lewinella sp. LCG006]|uniref:hypothetical protein n=1 Tax=Lewinella sp. LCG006 TaxID=3231911 RepID=UPI00345FFBFD